MSSKCRFAKLAIGCGEASNFMQFEGCIIGDSLDRMKCETVRLRDSCDSRGFHVDSLGLVRSRELRFLVRAGDRRKTHQDSPSEPCVGPAAVTRIHDLPDLKYLTHTQCLVQSARKAH